MNTGKLSSFSLWLMPSGEINDVLDGIISRLSRSYGAPLFPPHLTLLGNLTGAEEDLLSLMSRLAASIPPFQVTLTSVDYLDEYFRCLFLRAAETPALLEANREARSLFHRRQDPAFMPHLSLLYGDFAVGTKQQIVASIGSEFNLSFPVSHIHLFSTTGEPRDWYRVHKSGLQAGKESSHE